ncbi:MAG: tetratricopeptide repeat protein, partial [Acidobacteria bacterium]|nr:tetratricopeptide repeat protein [Acidobacteriota bacterium]
ASRGFDSVLLRAARDVDFTVAAEGHAIVVTLIPAAPPVPPGPSLRMELLQARIFLEDGRTIEAYRILSRLSHQYPGDVRVLAGLAGMQERIGRWRDAESLYDAALRAAPENQDIRDSREALRRRQGPSLSFETRHRAVADAWSETAVAFLGETQARDHLRAGFALEHNTVSAGRVLRPDGRHGDFSGGRGRGEMYLQHEAEGGSAVRGALLAGYRSAGFGLTYSRPDIRGLIRVRIDVRRSFWEFIETIVDGGTRDRVEVAREHRFIPRLQGWAAAAWNRYSIGSASYAAAAGSLSGGLDYLVMKEPELRLQYGFDGEYGSDGSAAASPEHPRYSLPLHSREVHLLNLYAAGSVAENVRAEGFAGFAKDRLGGSGPFLGANVTMMLPAGLNLRVDFERRLNSVNTGEVVHQIAGQLIWAKR